MKTLAVLLAITVVHVGIATAVPNIWKESNCSHKARIQQNKQCPVQQADSKLCQSAKLHEDETIYYVHVCPTTGKHNCMFQVATVVSVKYTSDMQDMIWGEPDLAA